MSSSEENSCRACYYQEWVDEETAMLVSDFEATLLADKQLADSGFGKWTPTGLDFDHGRVGFGFYCELKGSRPYGVAVSAINSHLKRLHEAVALPRDFELLASEDVHTECSCGGGFPVVRVVLRSRSQNSEEECQSRLEEALQVMGLGHNR